MYPLHIDMNLWFTGNVHKGRRLDISGQLMSGMMKHWVYIIGLLYVLYIHFPSLIRTFHIQYEYLYIYKHLEEEENKKYNEKVAESIKDMT